MEAQMLDHESQLEHELTPAEKVERSRWALSEAAVRRTMSKANDDLDRKEAELRSAVERQKEVLRAAQDDSLAAATVLQQEKEREVRRAKAKEAQLSSQMDQVAAATQEVDEELEALQRALNELQLSSTGSEHLLHRIDLAVANVRDKHEATSEELNTVQARASALLLGKHGGTSKRNAAVRGRVRELNRRHEHNASQLAFAEMTLQAMKHVCNDMLSQPSQASHSRLNATAPARHGATAESTSPNAAWRRTRSREQLA